MAQHDYVIDNQAFPATRADINSVLQAIVTNNSGSSAPSTTFANQIWYDSSANILYMRNEDNDANIPLLQLDQSGDVAATLATIIDIVDASGTNQSGTDLTIRAGAGTGTGAGGKIILQTADGGSSGSSVNSHATAVTIDDAGNVGVGITSSLQKFTAANTSSGIVGRFTNNTNQTLDLGVVSGSGSAGGVYYDNANSGYHDFRVGNASKMRLNASGTLLVGKTAPDFDGGVFEAGSGGTFVSRSGTPFGVNRNGSDGQLANFYKDGSQVGHIGTASGALIIGSQAGNDCFITFYSDTITPTDGSGSNRDNAIDIGYSAARFNDAFITNGVTTGSDQNEKQQIASLTDAEIAAAKRISNGFKTFKWNSAVTAKGDNARTHTGVIAQEVRTALEAEGLNAGNYAFFMSDTWWETQTEVPAVEAVEAVTETQTDDDGNEVEVIVQEAVEAQDAYTRVDAYYTADEAPEGATQKTRLGIRYPELLAFVGAATEQRLTSIEARLTALEG